MPPNKRKIAPQSFRAPEIKAFRGLPANRMAPAWPRGESAGCRNLQAGTATSGLSAHERQRRRILFIKIMMLACGPIPSIGDRDDDVAFLVSLLDIPVGLGDLL
jgi:hypothetical protein